jgi:dipeptide transport system ATP-binding protein
MNKVLEVKDLSKIYTIYRGIKGKQFVNAVNQVSFSLNEGQTLGIVGESGCGKSSLAKVLMRLENFQSGEYQLLGQKALDIEYRQFCKTVQMIFQDPYSSLNPRKPVWYSIAEPAIVNEKMNITDARQLALKWMERVGLRKDLGDRYPHMFSGGQRQRIGIARALVLNPRVVICDEPVSALDISVQAQVLNLLLDLQDELKLSYIFISHDLSVVQHMSDELAVMYFGHIVEQGNCEKIFSEPKHPYTQGLMSSGPHLLGRTSGTPLEGELPSPVEPPKGCPLYSRCPIKSDECQKKYPTSMKEEGREYACFNV